MVRRRVPVAADASPFAIQGRVYAIIGNVPSTRSKPDLGGQHAQRAASIANAFPTPPTSVTIGGSKTSLTVRIAEAEAQDREGWRPRYGQGRRRRRRGGGSEGQREGRRLRQVGRQLVRPQDRGRGRQVRRQGRAPRATRWKWSGGLVFQLAGDEVEELPDVGGAVTGAHNAIADSLGHLRSGGSLTDPYIKSRMGQIKPAIDAVGKVAARSGKSGATLRVTRPARTAGSPPASPWSSCSDGDPAVGILAYRCAWSFQVVRPQPEKSIPSMRRARPRTR